MAPLGQSPVCVPAAVEGRLCESFGGPDCFSRELGFAHLIAVHRGLRINEEQRARFVEPYMAVKCTLSMKRLLVSIGCCHCR